MLKFAIHQKFSLKKTYNYAITIGKASENWRKCQLKIPFDCIILSLPDIILNDPFTDKSMYECQNKILDRYLPIRMIKNSYSRPLEVENTL